MDQEVTAPPRHPTALMLGDLQLETTGGLVPNVVDHHIPLSTAWEPPGWEATEPALAPQGWPLLTRTKPQRAHLPVLTEAKNRPLRSLQAPFTCQLQEASLLAREPRVKVSTLAHSRGERLGQLPETVSLEPMRWGSHPRGVLACRQVTQSSR